MTIPTTVIPDVPEGTLDPAAGLNAALHPLRALVQAVVSAVAVAAPPGAPDDGECVLVGTGTGAFAGKDDHLARFNTEGAFWSFYAPGVAVWSVLHAEDLDIYVFSSDTSGGWEIYPPLSRLSNAANDAAAAIAGVPVGGNYRNGSVLMKRVT